MKESVHPLLFVPICAFILSACGSGDATNTPPTAAPTAVPTQALAATAAPTATTPGDVMPESVPQTGPLTGMEVVIEAPPEMAGITTLDSLKIVSIAGAAMCAFAPSADPFIVMFTAPPGQEPPTPVATFSLSVSGGVTPNQPTPATFEIGLYRPNEDPQMFAGEGTVVVAADGKSGTFETSRLKGRWTCTFAG